jgi:Na+-translocating ferredoxin:NAD+ oxidoreductase RNF subunit RnfB/anti-sigma regulatory factor (Ser/Thr protein kinase)
MITLSYRITGGDYDSAGLATKKLKEQLAKLGVDSATLRRAMIAAYEAEMNVVIHARTGTLWARVDESKLDLEVADEGPGIPDVELAMKEGWSTASERARQMGFGAGLGLPNICRSSDRFQIETRVGRGTRVRSTILFGSASATHAEALDPPETLGVDPERCRGCRRCIFACPVGALRVRERHPVLLERLCLGCTACIEECPDNVFGIRDQGNALRGVPDDALLLVPRGLLSAFHGIRSPLQVISALRELGFVEVKLLEEWEESLLSEVRREAAAGELPLPRIPPLCPPVVALIETRFPSLLSNISPFLSPAEAAGEEFPLRSVFLTVACPSQYSECSRSSLTDRLTIVSPTTLREAILPLLGGQSTTHAPALAELFRPEQRGPGELSLSGARNVTRALSRAETEGLGEVALLDLRLCPGGCSGSPLVASQPEIIGGWWADGGLPCEPAGVVERARPFSQRPGLRLDADMAEAVRKLSRIDGLMRSLPGRDCGSCGAPSCAAFAEDIVMGRAALGYCPFTEKTNEPETDR